MVYLDALRRVSKDEPPKREPGRPFDPGLDDMPLSALSGPYLALSVVGRRRVAGRRWSTRIWLNGEFTH